MKRLTFLAISILICTSAFAQQSAGSSKDKTKHAKAEVKSRGRCPLVFLNASSGLNNNTGMLGVGVDFAFAPHGSVDLGIGLGTWGEKAYLGAKYYLKHCHTGWAFGGGVTYSTGEKNFVYNLETVYGNTEPVNLNLLSQTNIFIAAYKYCSVGKRHNRFYLEMGWSVPVTPVSFEQTTGDPLSDNSVKTVNFISPGGLIIGAGFSFGVPRKK